MEEKEEGGETRGKAAMGKRRRREQEEKGEGRGDQERRRGREGGDGQRRRKRQKKETGRWVPAPVGGSWWARLGPRLAKGLVNKYLWVGADICKHS